MKLIRNFVFVCAAVLASAGLMSAQMQMNETKAAPKSPAATATASVDGKAITITYASPRVRGREGKIFSKDGLIGKDPTYPIWRAGANEATILKTEVELTIGSLVVPAGSYSLFVDVTDVNNWVLIINKQTGQWGTEYDKSKDLGRVALKTLKPAATLENLTYTIAAKGKKGTLTLSWENYSASTEFSAK